MLLWATSANLETTITAGQPAPFLASTISNGTITITSGTGPAGNNVVNFAVTSNSGKVNGQLIGGVQSPLGSVVGFGFQYATAPVSPWNIFHWRDIPNSNACQIVMTSSGALNFTDQAGVTTNGPSALTANTRHYIEMYCSAFGTNATVIINVDGNQYIKVTNATMSIPYPITATIGIMDGGISTWASGWSMDSLYWLDTGGAQNNYILGPNTVVASAIAAGVGQFNQGTPNGAATNWQCLNSIPPPGDTTYVTDSTVGDQTAVTLTTIATLGNVFGVVSRASARQEVALGGRTVQVGVGNGITTSYTAAQSLLTTYANCPAVFDINPNTGIPWVVGDMATLQATVRTAS